MNQLKTALLLGGLTALLLFVGNLIGGSSGLTFALVFALMINFGSYWFSDRIVLKIYKAKEVSANEQPDLHSMVRELAGRAKLPMPKVYIIPTEHSNAFATGRNPEHAAVAVTIGIMKLLSKEELKGVLAHELSHVKNRDTLISTVAATIAGVISYVAMMARWAAIFGGMGNNRNNGGGNIIEFLLLAIITPIIATIIQLAISRSREFLADESAAKLIHSGKPLASALLKIEEEVKHKPLRAFSTTQATAHLFIANPFRGKSMLNMFSTHPLTSERVRRLNEFKLH